jgi:predicted Zn-dependent protease
MTEKQEIRLGRESHVQIEREFGGVYPDPQIQQYVNSIGMEMARYAGRPNMDWQFRVLNSDQVNAFAVPGGYIYLTRGLLFRMRNEAQLAGVLAHEAGHIAHRDSVQQIQQAQGLNLLAGLAGLFGGERAGDITQFVSAFLQLKYSRDQEQRADMAGLSYMTRAGYNPHGLVQLMQILQQAQGARGGPPEFFSTHPDPGNRIEYLNDTIRSKYPAAAASGVFDGTAFRQQVLSRQPDSISRVDLDHPQTWCLHCHPAAVAVAAGAHSSQPPAPEPGGG